jgi:hypothetical protein
LAVVDPLLFLLAAAIVVPVVRLISTVAQVLGLLLLLVKLRLSVELPLLALVVCCGWMVVLQRVALEELLLLWEVLLQQLLPARRS